MQTLPASFSDHACRSDNGPAIKERSTPQFVACAGKDYECHVGLHSLASSFYLMMELCVHNDKTAVLLQVNHELVSTQDGTPT